MSDQNTEALNFGPKWIRDLSNGSNILAPPPSPGPAYKLAKYRYGKEEMLALFSQTTKPPVLNTDIADFILKKVSQNPLAMQPLTEEEQRNSSGSLNSNAVLKMMGRGGSRGGRGMLRGGRGSGRGRGGEVGFQRGFSQEDSASIKTEESWQREGVSRKQSWGDSSGRGGFSERSNEKDNETSRGAYESTMSSGRHSRALASGNWRSSETDDEPGAWMIQQRGSEHWRSSSREHWSREDQQKERWHNDKNIPEWSKTDDVFEAESGTFDASGAFCVSKDKKTPDDNECSKGDSDRNLAKESEISDNSDGKKNDNDTPLTLPMKDTLQTTMIQEENVKDVVENAPCHMKNILNESDGRLLSKEDAVDDVDGPSVASRHDEVGANLERVAESCIASLDVEEEEISEEKEESSSTLHQVSWYYLDPQGQEQGPFSNEEMVEWFHHGYFTMQLSVRRNCDNVYLSLGDLIKRWSRVPFLPGPSPPPITRQQVLNEQTIFMQQQLLNQHYQQLQKQAILQQIQQQQQLQQEQRQKAAESALLNLSSNSSSFSAVASRSLLTQTHPGSPTDVTEMIWGPDPDTTQESWSVNGKTSPWKENTIRNDDEQSKMTETNDRDGERKKQEEILKQKEEETIKHLDEEKLKRIAEERLLKEKKDKELQKVNKKVENKQVSGSKDFVPGKVGKGRGKLYDTMESRVGHMLNDEETITDELQKNEKMKQSRSMQKYDAVKQRKGENIVKNNVAEQKPTEDMLKRSKGVPERAENDEMKENKQKENFSESHGTSHWMTSHASVTLSLSEIQNQEEKNRRAHEQKMRELEARQRQLQSATTSSGWSSQKVSPTSNVKSLKDIQDEQARQLQKMNKQTTYRSQPAAPVSPAWNMAWTAGNNNVWSGGNDFEETANERIKNNNRNQQTLRSNQTTKPSSTNAVHNGKKVVKKLTKDEESVRKIFQESAVSNDPFIEWCTQSLKGFSTDVDVPTFIEFLKEQESPYEVHTYVREYFGDSVRANNFAKQFIEKRQNSEWKHVTPKAHAPAPVVSRGVGKNTQSDHEVNGNKTKKKKKQRMQKVDPSILGFSVNAAAERVNMGEIQSIND